MARASRESLRAVKGGAMAIWESWAAQVPRTTVGVDGDRVFPETTHAAAALALLHFCPDIDPASSLRSFVGSQPEVCNVAYFAQRLDVFL